MADTITAAGRALLAQCQAENRPCMIDRFILAYVPNQDASTPIAIGRSFPEAKDIVHEQAVSEVGFLNPDTISYTLFMDEHSGPFTFNTIYTLASSDNTVVQIVTVPDTPKIAENTEKNIRGQAMVRNLLLVYQNAQAIAQVTVEANAWQFAYEKATENLWGITQEATQEQVNEGAVAQRFVSPEKLENWWRDRASHRHTWQEIDEKPATYPPSEHHHDERYVQLVNAPRAVYVDVRTVGNTIDASTALQWALSIHPDQGFRENDLLQVCYRNRYTRGTGNGSAWWTDENTTTYVKADHWLNIANANKGFWG